MQSSLTIIRNKRLKNCTTVVSTVLAAFTALPKAHAAIFGGSLAAGLDFVRSQLGGSGIPTGTNITQMVMNILIVILNYVTLIAMLTIILAGLYLIFSNGDGVAKDKAKKIITYTAIGIVVILLSRIIVGFFNNLF